MIPSPDLHTSLWAWILLGPIIVAGFFLPGYLAFQRLNSPLPWLTSFIGSALLLFAGVLLLDLSPLRLNVFTLGAFLALAGLIGLRLCPPTLPQPSIPAINGRDAWRESWWILPAAVSFLSILLHGYFEPLSGFDNFFRWNYLAQLMESQGSLAHYPPITALDFRFYPWCDGIPPLVPIFNLWIYLGTSSTAPVLIVGRLLVELSLTLSLVWHLSRNLWGPIGARISILALSTSTLFLWSMGIEQETGLSGIAFLAIAALLLDYRDNPRSSTAIWIGLSAAFGSLCRDYNLVLIPAVILGLSMVKANRKDMISAAIAAILVAAPWYMRNLWITGNPFFPHELGGLFPTNTVHRDYMQAIQNTYNYTNPGLFETLLYGFLLGAGILFLLALPGLFSRSFGSRVIAALALIPCGLCLLAVPYTGGGLYYALRILGPALPLLAIAAGRWSSLVSSRKILFLGLGLGLLPFSADAARRSWIYPWFPSEAPWPYTWTTWKHINQFIQHSQNAPIWTQLKEAAQGESVVILHPSHHVLLLQAKGNPIPLFSPEINALTNPDPENFAASIMALRKKRVRFIILTDDGLQNTRFFRSRPTTSRLLSMQPALEINGMLIYDLILIERNMKQHEP